MQEGSRRAIFAALIANLGIAIAKFAAALVTGSASMLAESIHSFADTGNQGLLFLGGRRARRPADTAHPFGYGSERYFWAFVVALVLFTLGALFSLYEGIDKLTHPHELESPAVAFVVLGIAVVLEALSLRTAVRESRTHKGDLGWLQFIRRTKSPELSVVLMEDTGALVGLAFATTGLALAVATGETRFDAIGSIAIGVLLGCDRGGSRGRDEVATDRRERGAEDARRTRDRDRARRPRCGRSSTPARCRSVRKRSSSRRSSTSEPTPPRSSRRRSTRSRRRSARAVPEARLIYLEPDLDRSRTDDA